MKRDMTKMVLASAAVLAAGIAGAGPGGPAVATNTAAASANHAAVAKAKPKLPGHFKHLVVIYEENHSFDNLYGRWGRVNGQHVEGIADATRTHKKQVAQDGTTYSCLPQVDVNLATPPLSDTCQDAAHGISASHFRNRIFTIDNYIGPDDKTCPPPGVFAANGVLKDSPGALPGGCTRDLVHRFYQEQYQINGGLQNRYTTGSDAVGLTQGRYRTKQLPIYKYLHRDRAPHYVVADHFFQGAFGGSFLNHQWLISARAPLDTSGGANGALNSVLDDAGMVNTYPQYVPEGPVVDGQLTQECPSNPTLNDELDACGDFAVNTIQPANPPHSTSTVQLPPIDDDLYPNIGDRMSDAGISWNWYSGGWDDAEAGSAGPLFQYHHQPFAYFADYAPGQPGREHLQDEDDFFSAARHGHLPTVSFVKPYGAENEHPGYASEPDGSSHLVKLLRAITKGPQARNTLVVVTYDEFGGQWDHVSPPGTGDTVGAHDAWGPSTRIPALVLSRAFRRSGVDHSVYDTTSIMATIERSFGLDPVASRDAVVNDLAHAVRMGGR